MVKCLIKYKENFTFTTRGSHSRIVIHSLCQIGSSYWDTEAEGAELPLTLKFWICTTSAGNASNQILRSLSQQKELIPKSTKGPCRVAEEVSRWLPAAAARVRIREEHVGFVVDKAVLGLVFFEYFDFPRQSSFYRFRHHNRPIGGHSAKWNQLDSTPAIPNLIKRI
jgi:hypothetical protein